MWSPFPPHSCQGFPHTLPLSVSLPPSHHPSLLSGLPTYTATVSFPPSQPASIHCLLPRHQITWGETCQVIVFVCLFREEKCSFTSWKKQDKMRSMRHPWQVSAPRATLARHYVPQCYQCLQTQHLFTYFSPLSFNYCFFYMKTTFILLNNSFLLPYIRLKL